MSDTRKKKDECEFCGQHLRDGSRFFLRLGYETVQNDGSIKTVDGYFITVCRGCGTRYFRAILEHASMERQKRICKEG